MATSGVISKSPEYVSFRSSIQQKKVVVDKNDSKEWTIYDAGPRNIRCPLICLPPVSGTADVFFKQILSLSTMGYRVIAVSYPVYWSMDEFCDGFRKLVDHLELDQVHLFGASLGGFLAQKFAEKMSEYFIVHSLILCNSFCDTTVFHYTDAANMFWLMPSFMLKRLVMGSFPRKEVDADIADSIDFMVEKLEGLNKQELASRLTLNCVNDYVHPDRVRHMDVTIIDVFDDCAISQPVKDAMYKLYPNSKLAHLKCGGNFPYLSRGAEVNVHLQVHLRKYNGTKYSAYYEDGPMNAQNCVYNDELEISVADTTITRREVDAFTKNRSQESDEEERFIATRNADQRDLLLPAGV